MAMALGTIYETKLGSLKGTKGTGALLRDFSREVEVSMVGDMGAENTVTVEDFIPAGALQVDMTLRVVEEVTGDAGITGFDVGYDDGGFSGTTWYTNVPLAAGTVAGGAEYTSDNPGNRVFRSEADLKLTANADTKDLTGGRVRVCMFYRMLIAPPHRLGDPD